MTLPYDKADKWSILDYSKRLLGKTLEEAIAPCQIEEIKGKGRLGQLVEKYFFGYDINSNPEADFSEAGLELKCTPLKLLTNRTLAIKERLSAVKAICQLSYSDRMQLLLRMAEYLDDIIPWERLLAHIFIKIRPDHASVKVASASSHSNLRQHSQERIIMNIFLIYLQAIIKKC